MCLDQDVSREDVRTDVEAIKADIAQLRTDIGGLMHDMLAAGRTEAGEAKERLEAALRTRVEQLSAAADSLKMRGQHKAEDVKTYVRQNPLSSVGLAAALGLAVGMLVGRK